MILSDCCIDFLLQLSKLPQAKWLKGTHICYCGSEDPRSQMGLAGFKLRCQQDAVPSGGFHPFHA